MESTDDPALNWGTSRIDGAIMKLFLMLSRITTEININRQPEYSNET